jgi:phospholipid/cholesterol/gamma-HCH transport system ATP-binding protein
MRMSELLEMRSRRSSCSTSPTRGWIGVRTAQLCSLIERVHASNGGIYLVITHDIASARRIGEYLALMWKGRIIEAGDRQQMFGSETHSSASSSAGTSAAHSGWSSALTSFKRLFKV